MTKHNMWKTPTYNSWDSMIQRCTNPNDKKYKDYGGRGITVFPNWKDFAVFLADLGIRPPNNTLDRIDVNGNYEPGNVRWADSKTQSRNKQNHRLITALEENKCLADWLDDYRCKVSRRTLYRRLDNNWCGPCALTLPAGIGNKKGPQCIHKEM